MFKRNEIHSRRREVRGRREFRFRRQRFIASRAALALAALVAGGCYRYVPIQDEGSAQHEQVRVRITEDAAGRLVKDLGVYTTQLDGQYAQQGHDSVSLAVPIDRQYQGVTVGSTTQTLYLGRSEVVQVSRRQFDRGRTVLLSAGIVAGFAALAASIVQIGDPNDPSDNHPVPPPPSVRRPVTHGFTVRIPLP
jgi:hypothetical protein